MAIDKLKNVLWRLRKDNKGKRYITYAELRRCIIHECGVWRQTYYTNKKALVDIQWIKNHSKTKFELTDKDLTDS